MVLHKERYHSDYRRSALGLCRNDGKGKRALEIEGRAQFS